MPHIETPEGVRIRYEERGEGPPFALAHGFGVTLEMWIPQLQALSAGHRLILWDARGHGGSSAPDKPGGYTMPGLAADLRALLEQIGAVEDPIIGGMSFGGHIALQYAADHPNDTRALVLSDTTTRGDAPAGEPPPHYASDPGIAGAYHAMATRSDLTATLPTLTMPALVIYGDMDDYILDGIDRLTNGLPNRRVVRLSGCEHGTSAQRPREWAEVVTDFLDDVASGHPIAGERTV